MYFIKPDKIFNKLNKKKLQANWIGEWNKKHALTDRQSIPIDDVRMEYKTFLATTFGQNKQQNKNVLTS